MIHSALPRFPLPHRCLTHWHKSTNRLQTATRLFSEGICDVLCHIFKHGWNEKWTRPLKVSHNIEHLHFSIYNSGSGRVKLFALLISLIHGWKAKGSVQTLLLLGNSGITSLLKFHPTIPAITTKARSSNAEVSSTTVKRNIRNSTIPMTAYCMNSDRSNATIAAVNDWMANLKLIPIFSQRSPIYNRWISFVFTPHHEFCLCLTDRQVMDSAIISTCLWGWVEPLTHRFNNTRPVAV